MKEAVVLKESRLLAIRAQVSSRPESSGDVKRKALHGLSKERAAKWSDSLQAVRDRKVREKQERLNAAEAARVELDRQEALFREELRQQQVLAAREYAWEQTDDVKTLRRKLLLSSVLAERERQIAVNVEHAHLAQQQDAAFLAQRSKALQDAAAKEQQKEAEGKQRVLALADVRAQQLEAFKAKVLAERAGNRQAAEALYQAALQRDEQQKQKEQEARLQQHKLWEKTRQDNEALEVAKREQRQQERAAEATLAAYALEREAAQHAKRQANADAAARKAEQRRKMGEATEQAYAAIHAKAEAQLALDMAKATAKAQAAAAQQTRKSAAERCNNDRARQQQLADRQAQKERVIAEQQQERLATERQVADAKAAELAKAAEVRARHQEHAAFLLQQAAEKEAARDTQLALRKKEYARRLDELHTSEAAFAQYAEQRISEWGSQGKSALPMRKHLNAMMLHSRTVTAQ